MARKVVKTAKRPFEITPQKESVHICMCGLSKNQPFCDGSHKAIQNEPENEMFEYDQEGHQKKVD